VPTPGALALRLPRPLRLADHLPYARRPPFIAAAASPLSPSDLVTAPAQLHDYRRPFLPPFAIPIALPPRPALRHPDPSPHSCSRSVPRSLTTRTNRRQRAGGQRHQAQRDERDRPGRNPSARASETRRPRVTRPPRVGSHRPHVARQVTRVQSVLFGFADHGDDPLDRRELRAATSSARPAHGFSTTTSARARHNRQSPRGQSDRNSESDRRDGNDGKASEPSK
jgi:hypothetical protein